VTALLEVKDLELAYGQVAVCRGISLRLDRGEIVALIGANGAGKSTTLRAIAGLLPPRVGTIIFSGKDVTAMPSYERSKLGIALVPEGGVFSHFLPCGKTSNSVGSMSATTPQRFVSASMAFSPCSLGCLNAPARMPVR
jgi:ABC-type multidrug transport system ATPase subunit